MYTNNKRSHKCILTHIKLSDEAGHVVVLEELGEDLFSKTLLIQHQEAVALLETINTTMTHTHTTAPYRGLTLTITGMDVFIVSLKSPSTSHRAELYNDSVLQKLK